MRRWIEYLGWRAMDVVFVMLALLAVLVYLGISVFSDEGDE